jgi:hypothetical protein
MGRRLTAQATKHLSPWHAGGSQGLEIARENAIPDEAGSLWQVQIARASTRDAEIFR